MNKSFLFLLHPLSSPDFIISIIWNTDKPISGEFPVGVNSGIQYGAGVRSLAIALNTAGIMSVNRVYEIMTGILGVPINTGAIATMVSRFGLEIEAAAQEIKTRF